MSTRENWKILILQKHTMPSHLLSSFLHFLLILLLLRCCISFSPSTLPLWMFLNRFLLWICVHLSHKTSQVSCYFLLNASNFHYVTFYSSSMGKRGWNETQASSSATFEMGWRVSFSLYERDEVKWRRRKGCRQTHRNVGRQDWRGEGERMSRMRKI